MINALYPFLVFSMNLTDSRLSNQPSDVREWRSPIAYHLLLSKPLFPYSSSFRSEIFANSKRALQKNPSSVMKSLQSGVKMSHEIKEDQFTLFLGEDKQFSFVVDCNPENDENQKQPSFDKAQTFKRGFEAKENNVRFSFSFEWGD